MLGSVDGKRGVDTQEGGSMRAEPTPTSPRSLIAPRARSVCTKHTFTAGIAGQGARPDKVSTPKAPWLGGQKGVRPTVRVDPVGPVDGQVPAYPS